MINGDYDAIVIGSGPNGLAAAIKLAQAGLKVGLFERQATIGGGMRTAELTLPGFHHDVCSAVHPLGLASPYFQTLNLQEHGLRWIHPPYPFAHPYDNEEAAILDRSIEATADSLKENNYEKIMNSLAKDWPLIANDILAPLRIPQHPLKMLEFGMMGIQSATGFVERNFVNNRAKSFFAGIAAHSNIPLDKLLTASFGLILGVVGHVSGWPISEGGSQNIAEALASVFRSLGGKIHTGVPVENVDDLPRARVILCDISPKELLKIAGDKLPEGYKRKLQNYRYGPGVFKVDWALNAPIPWKDPKCLMAGTIHLGCTFEEIVKSESEAYYGNYSEKPFIIFAQQSLFDPTRAPKGKHTAWGYCHVPNGSTVNMTDRIEDQIERFAPGFKDCILAKFERNAVELEQYNPNYVGGDINGGIQDIYQLYTRPVARINPYSTPAKGLYICSASTPPGGAVHGMCGYHAAEAVLKECFR